MSKPLDISRLEPVSEWDGGQLRVYETPLTNAKLAPARPYAPYGIGYAIPLETAFPLPDGVSLQFKVIDGVLRLVRVDVAGHADPTVAHWQGIAVEAAAQTRWLTGQYLRDLSVDKLSATAMRNAAVRLYRRPRGELVGVNAAEAAAQDFITRRSTEDAPQQSVAYLNRITRDRLARKRGRRPVAAETIAKARDELLRRARPLAGSESVVRAFEDVGATRPVTFDEESKRWLMGFLEGWLIEVGDFNALPEGVWDLRCGVIDDVHDLDSA